MENYTKSFNNVFEDLQKAIRDRSHLTQKTITDKNGHTRKVWVNPLDKQQMKQRKAAKEDLTDWTGQEQQKKIIEDVMSDVLGGGIVKMRTFESKSSDGSSVQHYMIDLNHDKVKNNLNGAAKKIKDALAKKGMNVVGDIRENFFEAHWNYTQKIPAENRFAFYVKK